MTARGDEPLIIHEPAGEGDLDVREDDLGQDYCVQPPSLWTTWQWLVNTCTAAMEQATQRRECRHAHKRQRVQPVNQDETNTLLD